ncbi:MAG: transketolase [Helicobacteraceae bacterium]|jgi:transketolase|nr:transketolase [Helicobacteraceae bacterium]
MLNSLELARKIRLHALEMCFVSKGSHIGGMFSCADILAVLYSGVLNVSPQTRGDPNRDRLVLSKGHSAPALYAALAEKGFFELSELLTLRQNGSRLSGHVYSQVPGAEFSTGSLGQGVGVACGMALAAKIDNRSARAYAVAGDGECDEGSVWEAARFAAENELDNFAVVVDYNKMKGGELYAPKAELADIWRGFGWNVVAIDGHNHNELFAAFDRAKEIKGAPTAIIARTIKGKGVGFMEQKALWHYRNPDGEAFKAAWKELGGKLSDLLSADNRSAL